MFDKIIGQIERHVAAISARLRSTTDPMIRSLRCLIDAVHLAKTNRDANVAMNVIATMVQSFLEHYRPGCWRNQPHGLETMEHLKEAHMLTLRHMLSSDQAPFGCAWVTNQVHFVIICFGVVHRSSGYVFPIFRFIRDRSNQRNRTQSIAIAL